MSCFLCGHEKDGSHHLGCLRMVKPDLTKAQAQEMGLLPAPEKKKVSKPKVEVLKEGSMTTVPQEEPDEDKVPEEDFEALMEAASTCEYPGCDNAKYNDHPRTKYCEEHRDPKNRKE